MSPSPELTLDWMREGTDLFVKALEGLDDEALAAPGTLPGWTGKHVVAHVAANAGALGNLVHWATTGEETPMYASPEQRGADIETGSTRPGSELRHWVASSAARLAESLDALTPEEWARPVRTAQGRTVPATEIPWMRSREVMVHAVDLGGVVTFDDLPSTFLVELLHDAAAKRSEADGGPAVVLVATDDATAEGPADGPDGSVRATAWTVAGDGMTTHVRGPLAQLAAYATGREHAALTADGATVPVLPPWL